MKKLIAALLAAVTIAAFATGCMGGTPAPKVATSDEAQSKDAADYENTFAGLCNYLWAYGYINPHEDNADITYITMDYDLIGAVKGRKYTEQTKKKASIEIYEFDTAKSNATADEVINSIKKDGTFTILDLPPVKATLSNNGKYMMVYQDTTIKEDDPENEAYKLREEITTLFKEFHQ